MCVLLFLLYINTHIVGCTLRWLKAQVPVAKPDLHDMSSYVVRPYPRGKEYWRAREMTQQLKALAALPEDTGSIPSTHGV